MPCGDRGNIFQIVNNCDTRRTQSFTYDALNRIVQAWSSGSDWGARFTIDPWGNVSKRDHVSGKTWYEPFSASATVNNQPWGFSYDAGGNMYSNGSARFVYDAKNRITNATGTQYIYDAEGNRVAQGSINVRSCDTSRTVSPLPVTTSLGNQVSR